MNRDGAPLERPFFIELGADRLFAFLHEAAGERRGAVVFCHAFAEEKLWSHRVYVTSARELARAGYSVLRFDVRGEGDSSGEFEEATITTRVEDTVRAVDVARRETGVDRVVLLGHRLGGSIAALAAARAGASVGGVAVWDPLLDGAEYFFQLLRSHMTSQMATLGKVTRTREDLVAAIAAGEIVVVDGYGLTAALYEEISGLRWLDLANALEHSTLLVEVPRAGQTQPSEALAGLKASHPKIRVSLATEPPFWRETRQFHRHAPQFMGATLEWLRGLAS